MIFECWKRVAAAGTLHSRRVEVVVVIEMELRLSLQETILDAMF
jgi:hypothetical protein